MPRHPPSSARRHADSPVRCSPDPWRRSVAARRPGSAFSAAACLAALLTLCLPVVTTAETAPATLPQFDPAHLDRVVVYEINLRAFSPTGDLKGATARLDDLQRLGVNTLWLMPVHPIGKLGSVGGRGSPYAVQNYTDINPEFGTKADFDAFVSAAHHRGLRVLMDWVANHTARDHPWTADKSRYLLDDKGQITHPPGTSWLDVSALDYRNQALRNDMADAMAYWVEHHRIDGFRCDYADSVPADFWKTAISRLQTLASRRPKDAKQGTARLLFLAEGGKRELYDAGFDLTYGWDYYGALKDVYAGKASPKILPDRVRKDTAGLPPTQQKLRFTTNHDETAWDNSPVALFKGPAGAFGAFVLAATSGGTPLLYNGQEISWPNKTGFFDRDPIAFPLRASAEPPDYAPADLADPQASLSQYSRFLAVRSAHPALQLGPDRAPRQDLSTDDVAAFFTAAVPPAPPILVAVNIRGTDAALQVPPALKGKPALDLLSPSFPSAHRLLGDTLTLRPYETLVLSVPDESLP